MPPKGPEKPYSRQSTICDYCGIPIIRHGLKTHTDNAHPGKKVKERPEKQKSLVEMMGAPPPKVARVEEKLDDKQIEPELEETAEIEEGEETADSNRTDHKDVMNKLVKFESNVTKELTDIKHDLVEIKKEVITKVDVETSAQPALCGFEMLMWIVARYSCYHVSATLAVPLFLVALQIKGVAPHKVGPHRGHRTFQSRADSRAKASATPFSLQASIAWS